MSDIKFFSPKRKYFARIAWSVIGLIYPEHIIHEDFNKHSASNEVLSQDIESRSEVSSLNGLDLAFQQLGHMPFNMNQHVKSEPAMEP